MIPRSPERCLLATMLRVRELAKDKRAWFIGSLILIALPINLMFLSREYKGPQLDPHKTERDAKQAATKAAADHAEYVARYVNTNALRKTGLAEVAVVVASEGRKMNRTVASAIADHLKRPGAETSLSFFTAEFVSEGLLESAFNDPNGLFKSLELSKSLDFLVLARQAVELSTDNSLQNVLTASTTLDLMLISAKTPDEQYTWTLHASGAGFKESEARLMAQERLIKQIGADTNLTVERIAVVTHSK